MTLSPLSPEAVAQMVADMQAGTPGPWLYRPGPYDDWGVVKAGHCVLCQVRDPEAIDEAILSAHRRNGTDPWEANASRIARLPDLEAAYLTLAAENATLRASEAAALERIAELEAVNRSALDSRTHFKISAGRQKERCHKLRHRQRALLSALETIRFATSLDDAKFKANVAIGGWSDDELIYNARALTPTADKEPKT